MDSTSTVYKRADEFVDHSQNGERGAFPELSKAAGGRGQLATLYGPILSPLSDVERQFAKELRSHYADVAPVLSHGTQLGGKRLRPAMLLLTAAAIGEVTSEHVTLGTVIEMVHTATLVHDDVLDEAETRRHVPTVNARWNEHTSILLGDYLFAQSFRLAATLPSTEACRMIGEAARLVCEGELRQVLERDAVGLDEESYLSIIGGKTAELCRVACQLGARFPSAGDVVFDAMGDYGYSVGVAFQIADDFLDLWGDDAAVGKTLGTDIGQGKMTLPLIRLLQQADKSDREQIVRILTGPAGDRLQLIRPMLDRSDARAYTMSVAELFQRKATESLRVLQPSNAKSSLEAIAKFSVDRRF